MTHMILAGMALVLVVVGYGYVRSFSGINSCYLGLYKGVVEKAVAVTYDSHGYLDVPLIHIPYLTELLQDYFAVNLAPYCRDYTYEALGFDVRSYEPYILYSPYIRITFSARIDAVHVAHKTAFFQITRSDYEQY